MRTPDRSGSSGQCDKMRMLAMTGARSSSSPPWRGSSCTTKSYDLRAWSDTRYTWTSMTGARSSMPIATRGMQYMSRHGVRPDGRDSSGMMWPIRG